MRARLPPVQSGCLPMTIVRRPISSLCVGFATVMLAGGIIRNSQGRRHEGAGPHRKAARGHRGRAGAVRALRGQGRRHRKIPRRHRRSRHRAGQEARRAGGVPAASGLRRNPEFGGQRQVGRDLHAGRRRAQEIRRLRQCLSPAAEHLSGGARLQDHDGRRGQCAGRAHRRRRQHRDLPRRAAHRAEGDLRHACRASMPPSPP